MRIKLNGEEIELAGSTLTDVLIEQGYGDAVVATAVNGDFVAVAKRESFKLGAGDSVEILAPMQGG